MTVHDNRFVPVALHGQDFLASSHYKISHDERFIPDALKSTFHKDYIPLKDICKPEAALPPKPSQFMHKDEDKINMKLTETCLAFPVKQSINDDHRDKYDSLYRTNFKMDSDLRIAAFNTTQEHYYQPKLMNQNSVTKLTRSWMKSQLPQRDYVKAEEPLSNYR